MKVEDKQSSIIVNGEWSGSDANSRWALISWTAIFICPVCQEESKMAGKGQCDYALDSLHKAHECCVDISTFLG